ncbi:kh domain rna-binding protein [Apiospora sp. TS-2023a]
MEHIPIKLITSHNQIGTIHGRQGLKIKLIQDVSGVRLWRCTCPSYRHAKSRRLVGAELTSTGTEIYIASTSLSDHRNSVLDVSLGGADFSSFMDMDAIKAGPDPRNGPRQYMDHSWSFSGASNADSQYDRTLSSDSEQTNTARHTEVWQWPTTSALHRLGVQPYGALALSSVSSQGARKAPHYNHPLQITTGTQEPDSKYGLFPRRWFEPINGFHGLLACPAGWQEYRGHLGESRSWAAVPPREQKSRPSNPSNLELGGFCVTNVISENGVAFFEKATSRMDVLEISKIKDKAYDMVETGEGSKGSDSRRRRSSAGHSSSGQSWSGPWPCLLSAPTTS